MNTFEFDHDAYRVASLHPAPERVNNIRRRVNGHPGRAAMIRYRRRRVWLVFALGALAGALGEMALALFVLWAAFH